MTVRCPLRSTRCSQCNRTACASADIDSSIKELTGFIDQGNANAFAAQSQFIDMKFG